MSNDGSCDLRVEEMGCRGAEELGKKEIRNAEFGMRLKFKIENNLRIEVETKASE